MCTTKAIQLPEFLLGGQKIRYLFWNENKEVIIPKRSDLLPDLRYKKVNGRPLFLGSDVLAGISQMAKNHPRIHNRYSKLGMATKVILPDHRIDDIYNGHQVWFYNIQGLFQTVFEYHSRNVKKECLLNLRGLWLDRYEDKPLPPESQVNEVIYKAIGTATRELDPRTVSGLDLHSVNQTTCDFFVVPSASITNVEDEASDDREPIDIGMLPLVLDTRTAVPTKAGDHGEGSLNSTTVSLKAMDSCAGHKENSSDFSTLQSNVKLHDDTSHKNTILQDIDVQKQMEKLLQDISEKLEESQNCMPVSDKDRLKHLRTILFFALQETFRENFTIQTSFPAPILKSYTDILRIDLEGSKLNNLPRFQNCFEIEPHRYAVLCILSEWLGKEFNSFEKKVGDKVAEFKQIHIGQIGNLPEPQSLVESLFPSCMSCLLENWMGVHRTRFITSNHDNYLEQPTLRDHDYIQSEPEALTMTISEDVQANCQLQFPFIQIILEFTNNCLISGVAHVLYSRLRSGLL